MVSSGGLALVLCYLLFGASDCRLEHVFPLSFMEAGETTDPATGGQCGAPP